jgi:hypothetical protein
MVRNSQLLKPFTAYITDFVVLYEGLLFFKDIVRFPKALFIVPRALFVFPKALSGCTSLCSFFT